MITVVCPTYNEASSINEVLQFLSNAKPDEKEIIFIDGGSTDGTPAIIEKWSKEFSIEVIKSASIIQETNPALKVPMI